MFQLQQILPHQSDQLALDSTVRIDNKFASFNSFNSTEKAVQLLSAINNDKNNFKRPALTMNHISGSIIRGFFPKIVVHRLPRRDPLSKCYIHSALSNSATYRKGFRAFSVLSCIPFHACYLFVFSYCEK